MIYPPSMLIGMKTLKYMEDRLQYLNTGYKLFMNFFFSQLVFPLLHHITLSSGRLWVVTSLSLSSPLTLTRRTFQKFIFIFFMNSLLKVVITLQIFSTLFSSCPIDKADGSWAIGIVYGKSFLDLRLQVSVL